MIAPEIKDIFGEGEFHPEDEIHDEHRGLEFGQFMQHFRVDCIAQDDQRGRLHAQTVEQAILAEDLQEIVDLGMEVADYNGSRGIRDLHQTPRFAPSIQGAAGFRLQESVDVLDALQRLVGRKGGNGLTVDLLDFQ